MPNLDFVEGRETASASRGRNRVGRGIRSAPHRLANRRYRLRAQIRRARLWIAAYLKADRDGHAVITPPEIAKKAQRRADQRLSVPSKNVNDQHVYLLFRSPVGLFNCFPPATFLPPSPSRGNGRPGPAPPSPTPHGDVGGPPPTSLSEYSIRDIRSDRSDALRTLNFQFSLQALV